MALRHASSTLVARSRPYDLWRAAMPSGPLRVLAARDSHRHGNSPREDFVTGMLLAASMSSRLAWPRPRSDLTPPFSGMPLRAGSEASRKAFVGQESRESGPRFELLHQVSGSAASLQYPCGRKVTLSGSSCSSAAHQSVGEELSACPEGPSSTCRFSLSHATSRSGPWTP